MTTQQYTAEALNRGFTHVHEPSQPGDGPRPSAPTPEDLRRCPVLHPIESPVGQAIIRVAVENGWTF